MIVIVFIDPKFNEQWESWGESLECAAATDDVKFELIVIRTDSKSNKWDQMGLDEHLKASTVAGLIKDYRGASSYLTMERPNSTYEVTRLVKFKVKSKSKRMNVYAWVNLWRIIGTENQECVRSFHQNLQGITHAVVGVDYGAEAYCVLSQVFDEKKEKRSQIEERLSWIATRIENALDAHVSLDDFKEQQYDEETRKQLDRIKCRLYADCQTPICREFSVFDAYKCCLQVIEQVQTIQSDPISVILCPIQMLVPPLRQFETLLKNPIPDIDSRVFHVDRICQMWSDLEMLCVKVKMLQDSTDGDHDDHLKRFFVLLKENMNRFQAKLENAVIVMRMGFTQHFQFTNLLDIEEKHFLFGASRLTKWIDYKRSEQEMVNRWGALKGIRFVRDKGQLERQLAQSTDGEFALVLHVPLLNDQTKYILEEMEKYNQTLNDLIQNPFRILTREIYSSIDGFDLEALNNVPWFLDNKRIQPVTKAICDLVDHVKNNRRPRGTVKFFLTFNSEMSDSSFRYSIYQPGEFVSSSILEHLPGAPFHLRIRKLHQDLQLPSSSGQADKKNKNNSVNKIIIEWNCNNPTGLDGCYVIQYRYKDEPNSSWTQITQCSSENQVIIRCHRARKVQVRVAMKTCIGRGKFSDVITF